MRIDQDDIPEYIRAQKPTPRSPVLSIAKWAIAGLFSLGITGGAIYLADGDLTQLAKAIRTNDSIIVTEPPQAPAVLTPKYDKYDAQVANAIATPEAQRAPVAKIEWEQVEEPAHKANPSKQTSFNDQNYTPQKTINTIDPPAPIYASNTKQIKQDKIGKGWATWIYTYANRDKKKIYIEWGTVNGWVNTTTICRNEPKGSIEYRDCRKAAKEFFAHKCRTENHKAFCRAESFNPL